MKRVERVVVAFNEHSYRVFYSESEAMEFLEEMEASGEYFSLTPGKLEYNTPYYEEDDEE